jgi:hypothetical protein
LLIPIPLGASLSFINNDINTGGFEFEGSRVNGTRQKHLINTSFYIKRSLSLGGKTPFGIDCSGFTQMV